MTHEIKLRLDFCDAVMNGEKNFEVRNNDRGYQKGDMVRFIPYDGYIPVRHDIENARFEITYVLSGWGLKDGWVAFGIRRKEKTDEANRRR